MVKCQKQTRRAEGYHFVECGLDYVYLINGYKINKDTDFGECITVYNEDKLHRAIARAVLLHKEKLQGQEVRFFRSLLRLTQEQLANMIGVSRETVIRWESNKNAICEPEDHLLRIIVWEEYLDEEKAIRFFTSHKRERTHYKELKKLEMTESKNIWNSRITA